MNIIDNRREESNAARMDEWNPYVPIRELFARAFDAGVNAQRDYQEAQRQEAMDKARELYNAQRDTEPVAVMDVAPGEMIEKIKSGLNCQP
jgi:hypothetical protein